MISIIIPSIKPCNITLESLGGCPVPYEVIIVKKQGLGYARNYGAKQAKHDLLVFLDDDLTLKAEVWSHVLGVEHGEFRMTLFSYFPCTRVMAIHKKDYWSIGGFNSSLQYTEDDDFYVRALDAGLKFKEIPISLVVHQPHVRRCGNIHAAISCVKENRQLLVKYWRRYPAVFGIDFLNRAKRGQIRTLLLQLVFLLYYICKGGF